MDILGYVLSAVIPLAVVGLIAFIKKRVKVKSVAEQGVDEVKKELQEVKEDVDSLKEAVPVIMQCLLALLVAAKSGKINGECDRALEALNKYFISK